MISYTVEPLILDTPNRGHLALYKGHLFQSNANTLVYYLTSQKRMPLYKRQFSWSQYVLYTEVHVQIATTSTCSQITFTLGAQIRLVKGPQLQGPGRGREATITSHHFQPTPRRSWVQSPPQEIIFPTHAQDASSS